MLRTNGYGLIWGKGLYRYKGELEEEDMLDWRVDSLPPSEQVFLQETKVGQRRKHVGLDAATRQRMPGAP